MAEFETVEQKQLIAKRVPPGDRWSLVYAVERTEIEITPEPIKTFDFYGDGYQ